MSKKSALLLIIALYSAATYGQKFILSAAWRDSTIVIDGSPDDWDQPYRYFDSKSKLQYSVVNDARYIYVSIKTNDPKAQMKIMRAGMDVSFDIAGKKKELATIHFPIKSNTKLDLSPDPNDMEQQAVERPDTKKMRLDWSSATKEIHTQGFKGIPATITADDSSKYGIQAAINWDRADGLTYELKVPFSAFYKEQLVAADTLKPINIYIKANAMDLPMIATNPSADISGAGMNAPNTQQGVGPGGMPTTMGNNSGRIQNSNPQPTMVIPKAVSDMGMSLNVAMKIRLAYR